MFYIQIPSSSMYVHDTEQKSSFVVLSQFSSSSGGRLCLGKPPHHVYSYYNNDLRQTHQLHS